jgi:hypothetical protein
MFEEQPMPYVRKMGVEKKLKDFQKRWHGRKKSTFGETPLKHPAKMC